MSYAVVARLGFFGNVNCDFIFEETASSGVNIDSVVCKDGNVTGNLTGPIVCATTRVETDLIQEKTGGSGVTVDGVLLKDGDVTADLTGDVVGDVTGNLVGNVTGDIVGNVTAPIVCATTRVETDSILEKTPGNGVVIDGVTIKDTDVTIPGNLTVSGTTITLDTETVIANTHLIIINDGETGAGVTEGFAGIEVDRGTLTNYRFVFNETKDCFETGEIGDLQCVATRQDSPVAGGVAYWNDTENRFDTNLSFKFDGANIIGNVVGNLTGDVTGDISGNVVGDVTGNITGPVFCATTRVETDLINEKTGGSGVTIDGVLLKDGDVTGDLTGDVVGDVAGNVTGNVVGDVAGNITGPVFCATTRVETDTINEKNTAMGVTIDGTLIKDGVVTANLTGNVTGDVLGNVNGDVIGNVTGNLTGDVTGDLTGDVVGDVTGNLTGNVTGDVLGNVNGDLIGNVTGNLTGDVVGDVAGNVTGNVIGDVAGNITGPVFCATTYVQTDTIVEKTGAAGVTIDGTLIKDGVVTANLTGNVTGDVAGNITGPVFCATTHVATDTIVEKTGAMGVTVDGVLLKDGDVTGDLTGNVLGNVNGDVIGNVTGNLTGDVVGDVTGNLVGDVTGDVTGNITGPVFCATTRVETDTIAEKTGGAGVTVDGVLLKDGDVTADLTGNVVGNVTGDVAGNITGPVFCATTYVQTDTILEKTGGAGVTIDGVLLKDGDVTGDLTGDVVGDVTGNVVGDVTGNITGPVFCATTRVETDTIAEKTGGAGVTVDGVLLKDGDVTADLTGNVLGNVNGDVIGNVTGNLTGDVVGDITGNVVGNIVGDVAGNITGPVFCATTHVATDTIVEKTPGAGVTVDGLLIKDGAITGDITGNVNGDVIGNVTGNLTGDVVGDITGNVLGNVNGDLIGNVTGNLTGDVVGDITGNVVGNIVGDVAGNITGPVFCATTRVETDTIAEKTGGAGVTVDGVLLKDGDVTADLTGNVVGNVVGDVAGNITGPVFCATTRVETDTIAEKTGGAGVTVDGVLLKDGDVTGDLTGDVVGDVTGNVVGDVAGNITGPVFCATTRVETDTIAEKTGGAGVTVDGVLLKDSNVTGDLTGNVLGNVNGDVIGNVTGNLTGDVVGDVAGNVVGNVIGDVAGNITGPVFCATTHVATDTIVEKTGAAGVTIDGTLIKDGVVTANLTGNVTGDVAGNITGPVFCATTHVATDTIVEKTGAMGVTVDGVLLKDGDVTGDLTGNVLGNVNGDVIGNVTGNLTGDVVGDVTGNLVGNVTGNVTGDVAGNITGPVFCATTRVETDTINEKTGGAGVTIDGVLIKDGDVAGDLTGNVVGNVTGDLTGNISGDITGDVTGNLMGQVCRNITVHTVNGSIAATDEVNIINAATLALTFPSDITTYLTKIYYIVSENASAHTVTLGGSVTYDGTNNVATSSGRYGDRIVIIGWTTSRFLIVENLNWTLS